MSNVFDAHNTVG